MTKFKYLLLITLFSSFSVPLFANNLFDSIGVENQNGKKVIIHKVDPKENFYSIARRYNVAPKAIMAFNNNITSLSIGQTIKVPTDLPFIDPKAVKYTVQTSGNIPVAETTTSTTQYKVSPGETLYAISKRFNTTVDAIMSLNKLTSNNLSPGQVLLVKSVPPAAETAVAKPQPAVVQQTPIARHDTAAIAVQKNVQLTPVQQLPTPVAKRDTTAVAATQDSMDMVNHRLPANRYGLNEKNEKGTAVCMDSDNLDPAKKWVLHRTAPVGTVIKITNPMTNRTTFAKVVGRFADNDNTKDALLVMTKSVAESLGALDKRFHVVISYGTPE